MGDSNPNTCSLHPTCGTTCGTCVRFQRRGSMFSYIHAHNSRHACKSPKPNRGSKLAGLLWSDESINTATLNG